MMESNQLIGFGVITILCDGYVPYLSMTLLWRVLMSMTAAELGFTLGHSLMYFHPTLTSFHVLHQCCKESTFTTNVVFHPVDLAVEFAGPAAGLLGFYFFVFERNKFALLLSYLLFQVWYAADHDEALKLPHTAHHEHCDAMHTIYISRFRGNPKESILKAQMSSLLELSSRLNTVYLTIKKMAKASWVAT